MTNSKEKSFFTYIDLVVTRVRIWVRFITHEFVSEYKPLFEMYGLRFNIHIYGDYKSDNYPSQIEGVKLKEELYEKIKNKCTRLKSRRNPICAYS